MAVAAYASLVSLTHVLHNIQQRPALQRLHLNGERIRTTQEIILSLVEFLEVHTLRESPEMQDLMGQLSELAYQAEDIVDSHVVNQLYHGSEHDLDRVIQILEFIRMDRVIKKLELIKENLVQAKEEGEEVQMRKLPEGTSTTFGDKNLVVGIDEHVDRIIDELTSDGSDLQIIPIIGMGGIGKTTLAKSVYEHPDIANRFDRRFWVTVSLDYNIKKILLSILNNGENNETEVSLGEKVYKQLFNRRYLIVMDDMWSINAWDDLRRWFPENRNQSRIVMTTRLSSLHNSFGFRKPYFMTFLDEHSSWSLLCQTVFEKENCPFPELEEVGKRITKSCRGLPIEIVVIARLLANFKMSLENWKFVAENVNTFGNLADDEHCLNILSLSYKHLPIHLKPCFLFMRSFREDDMINVSNLMKLWVAEGFIKQAGDKSLEETAYDYLKDLIDRNMIFTRRLTCRGTIKICGIHDLLRDLCWRESQKENCVLVPKVQRIMSPVIMDDVCFLCCGDLSPGESNIHLPKLDRFSSSILQVGHSICSACKVMYSHVKKLRLVEVMDISRDYYFYRKILHPTTLRHVEFGYGLWHFGTFPTTFHLLWNLQTLNISVRLQGSELLPSGIWVMPQLRHIQVLNAILPDPVGGDFIILSNMQSLSSIKDLNCTVEIMERIPNLKELDLRWPKNSLCNLAKLQKLESLCLDQEIFSLENIAFPNSLKKLKLGFCELPWDDIGIIGSLPNLEVLVLWFKAFVGPKWNLVDGEFLRLKVLAIEGADLECWEADDTHFPNLVKLKLRNMDCLQEIPSGVGDIATLRRIELYGCADSVLDSAKQIWEEQHSFGNDSFHVFINQEEWIGNRDDDEDDDEGGGGVGIGDDGSDEPQGSRDDDDDGDSDDDVGRCSDESSESVDTFYYNEEWTRYLDDVNADNDDGGGGRYVDINNDYYYCYDDYNNSEDDYDSDKDELDS